MASLEKLLRDAAKRGELNYLSLVFSHSGRFSAGLRPVTGQRLIIADSTDPVDALSTALAQIGSSGKTSDDFDFG